MLKHNLAVALAAMILLSGLPLQARAETILEKVQTGGLNQVGQAYQSGAPRDIRFTIIDIINIALGFLGVIAVVLILYAGFRWMTAGGNEENVAAAKKILIAGVIGLVIILASYALANFVISQIFKATTGME
ncbi:MAG: hypothetical protein Q7R92_03670 [bacterium]|nr:hypothetical protein [bacterium]